MPSHNLAKIAAAGSGKSTRIIQDAISDPSKRILITTYTIEGAEELRKIAADVNVVIPKNITIMTWMSFLLQECIRPYQLAAFDCEIRNIAFIQGRSTRGIRQESRHYYLTRRNDIYSDKLSEFALLCNQRSRGKVIARLECIYDKIYVDEFQDFAGYDFNLLEEILKSRIQMVIVADPRQATFSTNASAKNAKFKKAGIESLFELWQSKSLVKVEVDNWSHRCNQQICDFADALYPGLPKTESRNNVVTGHDGVFLVRSNHIQDYLSSFSPTVLRHDKRTLWPDGDIKNFGAVKGRTYNRVLLLANGPLNNLLAGSTIEAPAKYYVALTRARYSVAICTDTECVVPGIVHWIESQ